MCAPQISKTSEKLLLPQVFTYMISGSLFIIRVSEVVRINGYDGTTVHGRQKNLNEFIYQNISKNLRKLVFKGLTTLHLSDKVNVSQQIRHNRPAKNFNSD